MADPWLPALDSDYRAKGARDAVSGLLILALLAVGDCQALGWLLLVFAAVQLGNMLIVLRHHGSRATAFSAHFSTGVISLLAATLVLTS